MLRYKLLISDNRAFPWYNNGTVFVKGFARNGQNQLLEAYALLEHISQSIDYNDFNNKIKCLNGFFCVVVTHSDTLWVAADKTRTFPLFYTFIEGVLHIADDAQSLMANMSQPIINQQAAQTFIAAGYCTGAQTLLIGLNQVQAGESICFSRKHQHEETYYQYTGPVPKETNMTEAAEDLYQQLEKIAENYATQLADSPIAISLSGGFDSRLLAVMLKNQGHRQVSAFTFGRKGNKEALVAEKVAQRLGIPWQFIEYTPEMLHDYQNKPVFQAYYRYAANLSSMFFMQDFFAVKHLKDKNLIDPKCAFLTGHSGDFLAGSHLKADEKAYRENLDEHIIKAHFRFIKQKQAVRLQPFTQDKQDAAWLRFENWDLRERQAKFIINSARVYSFFGHQWFIPLWDNDLIEFFRRQPFALKKNKRLYDKVLIDKYFAPHGLNFGLTPPTERPMVQRLKSLIKHIAPDILIRGLSNPQNTYFDICYDLITMPLETELKSSGSYLPVGNEYNGILTQWYVMQIERLVSAASQTGGSGLRNIPATGT